MNTDLYSQFPVIQSNTNGSMMQIGLPQTAEIACNGMPLIRTVCSVHWITVCDCIKTARLKGSFLTNVASNKPYIASPEEDALLLCKIMLLIDRSGQCACVCQRAYMHILCVWGVDVSQCLRMRMRV